MVQDFVKNEAGFRKTWCGMMRRANVENPYKSISINGGGFGIVSAGDGIGK